VIVSFCACAWAATPGVTGEPLRVRCRTALSPVGPPATESRPQGVARDPAWIVLTIVAGTLTLPTYVLAYRHIAALGDGPMPLKLVARLVVAGFGAFAPGGGFVIDKRALHAIQDDHRGATIRVLGLGALEWAVLAPAAWVCAIVLLASNDTHVMPSLLWP
jgi:hypothetical protein